MPCGQDVGNASLAQSQMFLLSNFSEGNITNETYANVTHERQVYYTIKHICFGIILPIILSFGVIGNILNIIVFTRGRFRHTLDEIERSAATGLITLAISDLFFCAVALPAPFFSHPGSFFANSWLEVAALYYNLYSDPVLNVFLFSSTWLVVVVSIERYLAVCHPIGARWRIRVWKTALADLIVILLSVAFNSPQFIKWKIKTAVCDDECECYYPIRSDLYQNHSFRMIYKVLWIVIGGILPFFCLAFCNIRLLVEIYKSKRMSESQRASQDRYCTSRITFILIAIIFLYFILVVPSVFLESFNNIIATTQGNKVYYLYQMAVVLTNVTQAIYFAMNFILYCSLSRPFRENLSSQIFCKNNSGNPADKNRYRMVKM